MRSLDKKWKELLFAFSGFGPNLLMVIMGSYFSDAMNPAALESGELDGERWESYLKLMAENAEAAEKARRIAAKQEKCRHNTRTGKYGGKGGSKKRR